MPSPEIIWWNGELVPWSEARIHVTAETALRGTNVFEGIRAYWRQSDHAYAVIGLHQHLDRLVRSAEAMSLPSRDAHHDFANGVVQLLCAIGGSFDVYLRPTIYLETGAYETDEARIRVGRFISWRPVESRVDRSLRCMMSTWMRVPSNCLPTEAKIGATYTAFRLARLEASSRGFDEAILLNQHGRIAETGGGSVFILDRNRLATPPLYEGILPGITRRIVLEILCAELDLNTDERPLEVKDLLAAEAAFVAGTLDEISRISSIDGMPLPEQQPLVQRVQELYHSMYAGLALTTSGFVDLVRIKAELRA